MSKIIDNIILGGEPYELADKSARDSISIQGEEIDKLKEKTVDCVTPQMFGAVADGETDDTEAIQAALDQGGLIYFPAGRYKVTSLLTASKSCRIEMFKQYPNCYQPSDEGNYPLTDDDNWMGSRIETYSPDGGIVIGASAEIDGFYMRAMSGFSGVLFKFDEREGLFNYPGTVRLSHIRLDVSDRDTIPEAMFDFIPNGSYRYFLDDINIGRRHIEFCEYGFRADLSQVSETNWANDVFIRGLCVDCFADYPLYVDGAKRAGGWQFDGLTIQAYPYTSVVSNNYGNGRTSHADIVTLKNLQETTFLSCYLWDLYNADYNNIFVTENVTNTSCIGCSPEFDQIESALSKQIAYPKNFTVKNLGVEVVTDPDTGDNQLTLSDPAGNIQRVIIPAAALDDEQLDTAVTNWMEEKSVPYEVVGKNKLNITSEDFIIGKAIGSTGSYFVNEGMVTTNYIEAQYKDIIRISKAGYPISGYNMACYDKDKNFLAIYNIRAGNEQGISPSAIEVLEDGTAYVRIILTGSAMGGLETLAENQICITVNNADVSYEPYEVRLEGGLGEFIVLQSENGSRYSVAVTNDGKIVSMDSDGLIKSDYATPQMFGAIGDGVTDDTAAVQAALDNGGTIYFPAGVYKVTKQLTTTKPCVIKMFKQYPSVFWRSGRTAGRYDYPLQIFEGESDYETEKGWDFGARLECYPSEGEQYGLLIGDGCEVDGLFMRAMNGFSGVLLAYDNSHIYGTDAMGDPIRYQSYPSAARFKHIRLDCDRHNHENTIPESMFDFYPHGKYFYIFDDIVIGHQDEFATYGFRSIVDEEATWANSVRLKNLCIDGLFDYPLYIVEENTKHSLTNWIFDGMTIQTYGYTYDDFQKSLEGHKAVMTLKRLNYCHFTGCYIWDLYAAKYTKLFDCENLNNISCVGCSEEFYYGTKKLIGDAGEEGIETVLKDRLQEVADDANIKTLSMSTTTLEDGSNRIELVDNHGNTIEADIPAVSLSDEQISTGVGDWMTENAAPVKIIGRNKLNIYSEDLILSSCINANGKPSVGSEYHKKYIVTPYIPAKNGDVFRMSYDGKMFNWSDIVMFDSNHNALGIIRYTDDIVETPSWKVTLNHSDLAYIRVNVHVGMLMSNAGINAEYVTLEILEQFNYCITLNNNDISYEPYQEELIGGLSQYFLLQSPNGTQYSMAVTDDGRVVGKDKDGNVNIYPTPTKVSELENDSGFVTADDVAEISGVPIKVSQLENDTGYITADEIPEVNIEVEQTYNPENENALSGVAVNQAINNIFTTTEKNEEPIYGEELINAEGWILNGWTGDLENGFTNTEGNTNPLIFTMPEDTGKNTYLVSFKCSQAIASESLFVTCGGSLPFNLYSQRANPVRLGLKSVQNGNLEFTPTGTFKNTITEISVKRVLSPSVARYQVVDSEGNVSFTFKTNKKADDNIFIGRESGNYNVSGYSNIGIGTRSLFNNTSGFENLAIGYLGLSANTVGHGNIAIGLNALASNTIGSNNTAIGARALAQNTIGKNNLAFGLMSLTYNKDGNENTAIGSYALYLNTSGSDNSAIGARALGENTTGNNNVAYGKYALAKNQTGGSNVAIGNQSCYHIKTQSDNTGIGHSALYRCNDGTGNTAVGAAAGRGIGETFGRGVFIGKWAGLNLAGGADYNTFIGFKAGDTVTTGKNNILLGQNVQPPTPETSNWINVGNLYEGSVDTSDKYAKINGGLQLSDIPTTDPGIAGRVWNDNGTLKVSAG